MSKNEQNRIDEQVRKALENLKASYNPEHWQLMEQRLQKLDEDDHTFDENFKNKVENLHTPNNAKHWELMAQRLQDLDDDEVAFDITFKNQVENLQKQYNSQHWSMMAQRLEEEFTWKGKIVRYKIVEVALMLLVLFTIFNYVENDVLPKRNAKRLENNQDSEHKSFDRGTEWRSQNDNNELNNQAKSKTQKPVAVINFNKKSLENESKMLDENLERNADNKAIQPNLTQSSSENTDILRENSALTEGVVSNIPLLDAREITFENQLPNFNFNQNTDNQLIAEALEPIERKGLKGLTINNILSSILPKIDLKKPKWIVGVYGLGSKDFVKTSFLIREYAQKLNIKSDNLGYGSSVTYQRGKLELQTGIGFNDKTYEPLIGYTEGGLLSGFTSEKLKRVNLKMLSIPINLGATMFEKGRFRIFTQFGANFRAVLASKVETQTSTSFRSVSNNSTVKFAEYERGLFQKEGVLFSTNAFKNNYYWTANAGLGSEFKFSPYISFFALGLYEKHIARPGIGSLNDRINSLSVQSGLKFNLNTN